jgi:hypothetical protein
MKRRISIIFAVLIFLAGAGLFLRLANNNETTVPSNSPSIPITPSKPTTPVVFNPRPTPTTPPTKTPYIVLLEVPFTSQAPLGQWSDPVYQNACEEASILMTDLWINGTKSISVQDATTEIKNLADFEDKRFGTFYDLSTPDTVQLMKEYYHYNKVEVKTNITADDIIQELLNGNIVIVPMNGQELHNPYYTGQGPAEHKILVKGYDFKTDKFITNDCGTRHGESYRYPKDVFFNAIREYPTGNQEPITSIVKIMVVVSK